MEKKEMEEHNDTVIVTGTKGILVYFLALPKLSLTNIHIYNLKLNIF